MELDPEVILEHFWHAPERPYPPKIWAVLDAARDPGVLRWLRASGLEHASLYSGPVPPEMEAVAPYLVRVLRREPASRELIESAWGNSWGIFLSADLMLEPLRRHLRHFLRVQDETGRKLLFRFYDPRVLRVYLPTCTARELWLFFGAIERFIMEADDRDTLLCFRRVDHRLVTDASRLGTHADTPTSRGTIALPSLRGSPEGERNDGWAGAAPG